MRGFRSIDGQGRLRVRIIAIRYVVTARFIGSRARLTVAGFFITAVGSIIALFASQAQPVLSPL